MIDIVRFWHLTAETGQFLCLLAGGTASCFLRMAIPRIVPLSGNTCTKAWYIVYRGLVHRLPRAGNETGKAAQRKEAEKELGANVACTLKGAIGGNQRVGSGNRQKKSVFPSFW
ncbi:MAG: hypothetical protein J5954_09710 [Prevotella sp.]|nr:hypothetical protein [Prevotella sp.]